MLPYASKIFEASIGPIPLRTRGRHPHPNIFLQSLVGTKLELLTHMLGVGVRIFENICCITQPKASSWGYTEHASMKMCVLYRSVLCLNLRLPSCWLHVLWLLDGCCQPVIRFRWTCFLLRLTMKILLMCAVSSLLGEDCGRDLPPCKHHVPLGSFGTRIFWNHPLTSPVPPPQQYSLYTWCNYKTSEFVVALKLTPKTICTCNATG